MANKTLLWIGFIIGAFYTILPHDWHIISGLDLGFNHTTHIIIGIILIGTTAYYLFKGGKK